MIDARTLLLAEQQDLDRPENWTQEEERSCSGFVDLAWNEPWFTKLKNNEWRHAFRFIRRDTESVRNAALEAAAVACEWRETGVTHRQAQASCRLCAKDIRALKSRPAHQDAARAKD